jgi:hypothetical protein
LLVERVWPTVPPRISHARNSNPFESSSAQVLDRESGRSGDGAAARAVSPERTGMDRCGCRLTGSSFLSPATKSIRGAVRARARMTLRATASAA